MNSSRTQTLEDSSSSQAHPNRSEMSFGMRIYRAFFRTFFRLFGPWLLGAQRWQETQKDLRRLDLLSVNENSVDETVSSTGSDSRKRIWFHAASVGELESLWPLVQLAQVDPGCDAILSVFSSSAWAHVHRLARKLDRAPLFAGYSPIEGDWTEVLTSVRPHLFVTAKYEAWPEIWNALGLFKIPLAIIGAKPRSSLIWAKRILRFLGGRLPSLLLFSFDPENEPGLVRAFPESMIFHGSDPRWDRVFSRSRASHSRVAELAQEFADLPRPWGVVGSAWPSDIQQFKRGDAEQVPGTVWFVPHRTDQKSISEIEILLRERGWTPVRTGSPDRIRPAGKIAVIVDEMGFLAELYACMDWAMVGGGFGTSIHSTIEPSIYGLPITGGPKGQEKFDEIALLVKQGQMQILGEEGSPASLYAWILQVVNGVGRESLRARWKVQNAQHIDASARTWKILAKTLKGTN